MTAAIDRAGALPPGPEEPGESNSAPGPEALWLRFQRELRSFVAKRVAPPDLDDLLQIIYLRIHKALTGQIEITHSRGWIYLVARSALSDYLRSTRAMRAQAAAFVPEEVTGPAAAEDNQEEGELAACLRPLLETLPEPYRDALAWIDLDGMTQEQAAAKAGISLTAMKSRVQRGRERLKSELLRCCEVHLDSRSHLIDYRPRSSSCRTSSCRTCGPRR